MDSSIAIQVISSSNFSQILDDLCVRFIMFLPEEELSSIERICFQIEEAHWYYEDFIREINTTVPNLHLRQFIHQMFNHVPRSLISHIPLWKTETAFTDFMTYKTRVPVRGCIMLNVNMDQCVLVKGWKSGSSWCFPRGKIDQDEDDRDCAVREVLEETGYDLTGMVGHKDFIDINIREQNMRLYIAPGVPEDFEFAPRTRKEISKIAWHKLSELPGYSAKKNQREQTSIRQGRFFLVAPFIRELRKWITTSGKAWLAQQQEVAISTQEQMASAAEKLTEIEPEVEVEYFSPLSPGDSAAGLKSLLGIKGAASVISHGHMNPAEQDEASRRLREMIGGTTQNPAVSGANMHGPPSALSGNPNAEMLLSILRGPTATPSAAPQHSPPSHISPHPSFMAYPQNQPVGPSRYQHPQPLQQRQPLGPVFHNSPLPINSYHLPSPPPTSRYGAPSMNQPCHPQHQHQHQRQGPVSHMNLVYPGQPTMHHVMSGMPHQFGQSPPTPVDAFLPSKPPDPGQAGTLLSILKGTALPQIASPPQPPPQQPVQPPAQEPPIQKATQPSAQQMPQSPPKTSNPRRSLHADPAVHDRIPANPIPLQTPPPPRGPKSQIPQRHSSQRHSSQRQAVGVPSRPSTTVPSPQVYAPPPRPTTTQPRNSPPLRRRTPIVIDHYGTQKAPNMPSTSFDRRESVSGEHAKALLAMFRKPNNASESSHPAADEVIMSSPEMDQRKPAIPGRLSTPSGLRASKVRSPAGRERAGLLAYLENVANSGGGVSLSG